ncbi:MAG TPA: radical SAM protein [Anaerolineae bacterium]|nr:radical SAM protein [Anaerolineae bacterium]
MRYSRVLIVNPESHGEWKGIRPHIGLGYLTQALQDRGIEYDYLDMNFGYTYKQLQERIEKFKPELIGLSLLSMEYKKFYRLIAQIKRNNPDIPIVAGGPHVTILKTKVLEDCPELDYGVIFEGEDALSELCLGDDVRGIKNLIHRSDGAIVQNEQREFKMNLDELSWPRYEKFELEKYVPEVEIYSSRGCPHECIFCPNRLISPIYRARSPKHVVDEMQYWYEKGYRQFNFDDDNFNYVRSRVFAICDEIERRGLKNLFLRCSNGIRADRADREMLVRMKEVGFHYIAFGADAGNNRMLEIVKKGETIEDIERAVKNACELGYDTKLLFVVGTPQEAWDDVEDKVRLSRKYPVKDVHFYNIIPYPGTELFDWIKEKGYFLRDPADYLNDVSVLENTPVFETPELPAAKRKELFNYLRSVQNEVHRKAITSMFDDYGVLGKVAGYILANQTAEKLFYQNFAVRRFAERLRYKKAVQKAS